MSRKFLLATLLSLISLSGFTQSIVNYTSYWDNYLIRNISREQGLFRDEIYDSIQDSSGFIWMANYSFTFKYDGLSLKEVGKDLALGTVNEFEIDKHGNIWVSGTESGLHRIIGDSVTHYTQKNGVQGFSTGPFSFTNGDSVFIGDYLKGVSVLYQDTVVAHLSVENGLSGDRIAKIVTDSNNRVWIGSNNGLDIFHNGSITSFTTKNGLPQNSVRSIHEMLNGEVWVGTETGGIVVFKNYSPVKYINQESGAGEFQAEYMAQNPEDSSIIIGYYGGGLDRFYKGTFERLTTEDGIISDIVNSVRFGKNGIIYISTDFGLSLLTPRKIDLIDSSNPGFGEAGLEGALQDSEGTIWASTTGDGIKYFDGKKWASAENSILSNQSGRSFKELPDKKMAVATGSAGLVVLKDKKLFKHISKKDGLLGNEVLCLETDKQNNLWVGTFNGFNKLDEDLNIVNSFTLSDGIPDDKCLNMISDSEGNIWIASLNGGLFKMQDDKLTASYDTSDGLSSTRIFGLYRDNDDAIWFSAIGLGLYKIKNDKLSSYPGLPQNVVSIVEDDQNNFWLSSNGFLIRVERETFEKMDRGELQNLDYQVFTTNDGIPSTRFAYGNSSTSTKIKSGELLFPAKRGMIVIKPEKAIFNTSDFRAYIDEFLLDGNTRSVKDQITIPPGNNKIEIKYSAINLESPEKTKFRVMLKGIDKEWANVGDRRTAFYDFLPDGNYEFLVSAIGPDGNWSPETASLSFTVLPPFYKTWWFAAMCLLSFGGAVAGGVQIRSNIKLQALNRELTVQQKIHEERERISRDLHDNVGAHITNLITGIEISNLHLKKEEVDNALGILSNLDSDARNAMSELRETIWLLDRDEVSFQDFRNHINKYIQGQKHYLEGISVNLSEVDSKEPIMLNPTQSLHLLRIIQEALNNSRKYSEGDEFSILFFKDSNIFSVVLKDNGIGFEIGDLQHAGNGLKNMERRISDLDGTINIISSPGNGVEIKIAFPLIIQQNNNL